MRKGRHQNKNGMHNLDHMHAKQGGPSSQRNLYEHDGWCGNFNAGYPAPTTTWQGEPAESPPVVLLIRESTNSVSLLTVKYPHIRTGHTAVSKYPKVVTYLYPSSQLTWLL
jgi:hypothetical protein